MSEKGWTVIFVTVLLLALAGMSAAIQSCRNEHPVQSAAKVESFTMKGTVQYCDSDGIVLQDAGTGALVPMSFDFSYRGRRDIQPRTRVTITFSGTTVETVRVLTLTEE